MSAAIEPNDSKSCRAALAWADAGVEVFSIHYGKKKPATTHGFLDATRGPDLIRAMFPPGRKRNLGIRTGERSGIVVIDEDGYKEGAKDTLKAIEAELGPLPETFTVQTRAGGRHLIFEYPEGRDLRCPSGEEYGLGFGIDVRGNGGYIVGPGSWVDQDNKGPPGDYKIIVNAPIAKLPAAWIDRIEALSRGQKPGKVNGAKLSSGLAAFGANVSAGFILPETIKEGGRNDTLFRYLGHLLGKGVPKEIAEQAVRDANAARCQPSLDDAELEVILKPRNNATENEGQAEGEEWPDPDQIDFSLPPVPDFEVDEMLPDSQAENIRDEAERMQVPPEAIAAARAVGLGALVGTQIYICPLAEDVSWMVPGNAFGFLCANPGRMKSECVAKGLAPIKALERELDARNKAKRDEYEVAKVRYEVELVGFKKMVKGGATGVVVPQPPEEPKPERLIAVDATVAKLGEICAASPNGVLIERDEITGLLSQLGAPGHEGDREFYLTGWNGVSGYKVDRIGRGSLEIPQLALSLFGGVQPGKLVEYVRQTTKGGAGADGLLARMQYAVYPDYSKQYQHIDRRPNLEAYEKACNAARRLFKIDPTAIGAKTALGSGRHYLHFSTEAQALFNQWRQGLENSIRKGSLHPSLESHFAKFRSLIPKTALIFHLVEGGTGPVTIDALIMAIRWGNFLAAHARRVYAGALHGADLATKALADKVKANKVPNPFRARDVYRAGWAGLSDRTDVEPAIEGLLDAGWIREEVIKGAGRATVRYWINPKIHPTGT